MSKRILILFACVVAALVGYFAHDYGGAQSAEKRAAFPDANYETLPRVFSLACDPVLSGSAFENRLDNTANASAAPETYGIAMQLSEDQRTLSVLYAYDVQYAGATEPLRLRVESRTNRYVIAAGEQTLGNTSVIIDARTRKAVVSFTGQGMLGIKGTSLLVQCH